MLSIYTDGGVSMKNQIGGWAAVVDDGSDQLVCLSGYEEGAVTNNTMELTAVIEALKFLDHHHPGQPGRIVSDSEYVVKGVTEWAPRWRRNRWKGVGGKVKNRPHWEFLLSFTDRMPVSFQWVRGHDGNECNEVADRLCVRAYTDRLTERAGGLK